MRSRILVVGGTGAFGRRLVEGLLATTKLTVIVAGRSAPRNERLAESLRERHGNDRVETVVLDRGKAHDALVSLKPFCVIDAAGPFQGAEPLLARAAIAAGCHYVDLADARDFVAGFSALDEAARKAGVLAIAGASSTPALSGTALDALVEGWRRIDEVEIAISPGNRAPRGLSVVEAILAYAGAPVRFWINREWTWRPGWGALVRREIPGIGRRWLSLCETPDLDLLPARYPSARTVLFRAGLELSLLHVGLWLLTFPVRWRLIRSLRPLAVPLHRITGWFERFGTDRGGMVVEAVGEDREGRPTVATWSLVADAGDGPNIPVLPTLALVRGLCMGRLSGSGARIAADLVSLEAIEQEFLRFRITTRRAAAWPMAESLFERVLGPDAAVLPEAVRAVHMRGSSRLAGRAVIDGAAHLLGRLVARIFGFPHRGSDEPAEVSLVGVDGGEIWTRRFGNSTFRSTLRAGPLPHRLEERFGPFRFDLAIAPHPRGFDMSVTGWRIGRLRLPTRWAPTALSRAFVGEDARYHFDVSIALPWIGPLIRYRGWLEPARSSGSSGAAMHAI
jgi:hypothetical protein